MSNFEFVDRRGSNKVEETAVAVSEPEEIPLSADRNGWKKGSLVYLIQITPVDNQPIVSGNVAAIRSDGLAVTAGYLLEQVWSEGFRWEPKAKKRLDTFLGCECQPHKICFRHKHLVIEWLQEDRERLARSSVQAVPEVVEILIKQQAAKQAAGLAIPRG